MKKPLKKVIILTGPSGAGKSEAARLLARKGFRLLKGDEIARGLYAPGKPLARALFKAFGPEMFRGARLNRAKLGALVFSNPPALKRLNGLLHPALIRAIQKRLVALPRAVVDMAVYFSAGAPSFGGAKVLLLDAPLKLRLARLAVRYGDAERARRQAGALKFGPRERGRCDAVIVNSGTRAALKRALDQALSQLL